jgi:oxalate decarboxylase
MSTNSSTDKQPKREITRRDFLKLVGAAGAVLATLPSFIPFGQVVGSSGTNSSTNINRTTSNLDTSINKQTSSVHIFNLDGAIPQFQSPTGSRTLMNADNFPILSGMGAVLLLLKKGGVREPHWHPNASELGYCITGNARMTIFMTNARHVTFTINPGQLIFIPRGYWHDIENIGKEEAKFVIVYDNERPEDLGITGSVGSMSARVLDRIFGIRPPGFFDQLNYKLSQDVIVGSKPADFSSSSRIEVPNTDTNSYKYSLGSIIPQIQTSGGTAALGTATFFPILSGLALFLIRLKPSGIVEPHTHPNAAELNYVVNGKVRFTVFGPSGEVESSEIGKGQVFFVPSGYFHYLENPDNVNGSDIASFFNNESPEFIGLAGGLSAYSNEVLGSTFNKDPKFFSSLPRLDKDVFIASGTG